MKQGLGHNKVLITHTDMDGIGCAYIFLKCYPKGHVFFADHDNVDEMALDLIEQFTEADFLFTDISVNSNTANILNDRGRVALLDHHATAEWLNQYEWASVVQGKCGTRLIFEVMSAWFNLQDLESTVDMIEDWDLWGHGNGPGSKAISYQFMLDHMGKEDFLKNLMVDHDFPYNPEWAPLLDKMMERYEDYYQTVMHITQIDVRDEYSVGITLADQYISLIGNRLCNELDLEYVMILDKGRGKASLRGRGNIDLSSLAKQAGGGGHRRAAGFPI